MLLGFWVQPRLCNAKGNRCSSHLVAGRVVVWLVPRATGAHLIWSPEGWSCGWCLGVVWGCLGLSCGQHCRPFHTMQHCCSLLPPPPPNPRPPPLSSAQTSLCMSNMPWGSVVAILDSWSRFGIIAARASIVMTTMAPTITRAEGGSGASWHQLSPLGRRTQPASAPPAQPLAKQLSISSPPPLSFFPREQ